MPNAGDQFTIQLKHPHLNWGTFRHTHSRERIYGEAYIPIPAKYARQFEIYNSHTAQSSIYRCDSIDGYLKKAYLKAVGCNKAGDKHAKQFQGNGNLKLLGHWLRYCKADIGDQVIVLFIASNRIRLEHIAGQQLNFFNL